MLTLYTCQHDVICQQDANRKCFKGLTHHLADKTEFDILIEGPPLLIPDKRSLLKTLNAVSLHR